MRYDQALLEQIKDRLVLSEIVGAVVRLRRAGKEFTGLCPFHGEKTPSFTVNNDKGFYHCFGCGAHGSVFDFFMHQEGLTFPDAIARAAAMAGVSLPEVSKEESLEKTRQQDKYDRLYAVMEAACRWFEKNLSLPLGESARSYLDARGVTRASIEKFRLGYAPSHENGLQTFLQQEGYTPQEIEQVGLVSSGGENRALKDKFRGRLVFPILDRKKRVVAFGGRALSAQQIPKYLNSPETALFHKGKLLYNFAEAQRAGRIQTRQTPLLIVEGYMDVIALDAYDLPKAVAPLGTALTEDQLHLAWRIDDTPYLVMDGDEAGRRAQQRVLERALPLLQPDRTLFFTLLPEGEDPDSFVKREGFEGMYRLCDRAQPLIDVLWESVFHQGMVGVPEKMAALEKSLYEKARLIQHPQVRHYYEKEIKNRLYQASRAAKGVYGRGKGVQKATPAPALPGMANFAHIQQSVLIAAILKYPTLLESVLEPFSLLSLSTSLKPLQESIVTYVFEQRPLESEALEHYLMHEQGFDTEVVDLFAPRMSVHLRGILKSSSLADITTLWWETYNALKMQDVRGDQAHARAALKKDFSEQAWERFKALTSPTE